MSYTERDLTLDEVLSDPVIGAAMRADRVDPRRFEILLRTTARRLDRARHPAMPCAGAIAARLKASAQGTWAQGGCAGW